MAKEKRTFVKKVNGYGLTGMVLKLSLAQCQVLSAMHEAFRRVAAGEITVPTVLVEDTLAFLKIFKDVESPVTNGIWDQDEDEEEVDYHVSEEDNE